MNHKKEIRAILFDLDGTLVDTIKDIAASVNAALATADIPPIDLEMGKSIVGRGLKNALRLAGEAQGQALSEKDLGVMLPVLRTYYETYPYRHAELYPGVEDFLRLCRKRGYELGVLSNKDHHLTVQIVEHMFPGHEFSFIQGASEKFPLKPSPASTQSFLEQHGIDAEHLLIIGDTEVDALTARESGSRCALVSWGFRGRMELESYGLSAVYDTFEQLAEGEL